jgi:NDP-sugar pyrophosphorylase family protein
MLNIVIPMAGHGSRFSKAGYTLPKPLIPVNGIPMIKVVIDNLAPTTPHRFILICQAAHLEQHGLREKLQQWAVGCEILTVEAVTEGAACTVLLAETLINNQNPLMIANCDQYVDVNMDDYLNAQQGLDGLIMTMKAHDDKWSFVRFNEEGAITEVVEKVVVSDEATVGIYNFTRGADFVSAAKKMIAQDLRVNGEFYVAPAYNQMIAGGAKLGVYNIGSVDNGMYGLGVPEDLERFLTLPVASKVGLKKSA